MYLTVVLFPNTAISNAAGGGSAITWVHNEGCEQVTHDKYEGRLWSKPSGNCLTTGSLEEGTEDVHMYGEGEVHMVHTCVCIYYKLH